MTSKKITSTLGNVADSLETAWNRLVMGVRTRHMPKTIKKVKKTLQGSSRDNTTETDYNVTEAERATDDLNKALFYLKYMGSTLVEELVDPEPGANYFNTGLSTKALDRIVRMTRNNDLVNVSLIITLKSLQIMKLSDRSMVLDVELNAISFCTHDKKYGKIISFIAKNMVNGTMECHALLCERQKVAISVATALAQYRKKSREQNLHLEHDDNRSPDGSNADVNIEPLGNDSVFEDSIARLESTLAVEQKSLVDFDSDVTSRQGNTEDKKKRRNIISAPAILDDDFLPPVCRERADSDSWAVTAVGSGQDSTNVDLELEFSNFARSRSITNITELNASVHSIWDI